MKARFSKIALKTFLVRLGLGVLVLNLFVILMTVVSLRQSWHNHQELASAAAQNLAQVLERYVADTFSKADLAVWAVKDEIERPATGPSNGRRDLEAFIRRQLERAPGLLALRTTDARGVIDHGGGPETAAIVTLADREHFIRLRDVPNVGLVISKPLVGKLTGTWVIILARRLERPDHSFAGMVHAVIELSQFDKAFAALDVGAHGSVALRDLDLGLIARFPSPANSGTAIGQKVVSDELQAFARSGRNSGIYTARTPFDRVQRTFSIRRVSEWPCYLLVGLAEQDYLSGWRRETTQQLGHGGVDVIHFEADVVDAGAALCQELADGALRICTFQVLQGALAHGEEGRPHLLLRHFLRVVGGQVEELRHACHGFVQAVGRDAQVVDAEQLHGNSRSHCTPTAGGPSLRPISGCFSLTSGGRLPSRTRGRCRA